MATMAVLALAVPVAAHARGPRLPPINRAAFLVTVTGTQVTLWAQQSVDRPGTSCEFRVDGAGSERARFFSRRAVRAAALRFGQTFLAATIPVRGSVTRRGQLTSSGPGHNNPDCAVAGGECEGGNCPPPPAPDCGTRTFRGSMQLQYFPKSPPPSSRRDLLQLTGPALLKPLFQICPAAGATFPPLATRDHILRPIGTTLPPGDLFNRRLGKLILIARETFNYRFAGISYVTTVRWEATLRRVRR
jgi:hypothetical protein